MFQSRYVCFARKKTFKTRHSVRVFPNHKLYCLIDTLSLYYAKDQLCHSRILLLHYCCKTYLNNMFLVMYCTNNYYNVIILHLAELINKCRHKTGHTLYMLSFMSHEYMFQMNTVSSIIYNIDHIS